MKTKRAAKSSTNIYIAPATTIASAPAPTFTKGGRERVRPVAVEFSSLEEFIDYKLEVEEDFFSADELGELARGLGIKAGSVYVAKQVHALRLELEALGLEFIPVAKEKSVRTFKANNHDRWIASPTFGGSGASSIVGSAVTITH